ncbi:hypothetical protein NXC14_PC00820 (plasmid) [Rhizobium sp. NXC14]|uniref:hypothetical protein n=1 Tax=Rhizobium sp. NXC14 TaxID=1981173 RepID=UPI000A203581|nr:hypothetical protein [Rhizobium sp. NXC14]ARO34352.1 hypothetical protein NXC14_PC00820 [Rhizobium sp. NXC14]
MNSLAQKIVDAHGGLDTWNRYSSLTAHLKQGGALWALKGQSGKLDETNVTVGLREEWASHSPLGPDKKVTRFEPGLVIIKDSQGSVLESLPDPRSSFEGHSLETAWTEPQLAYFAGVAMWTYLNVPFLLAAPGVVSEQLEDWQENGETWQRLKVTFPSTIATHSTVQALYVGADGLLKRHDYDVEIAGNTPGAHYIGGYLEVQGLKFPTERRIYPRQPDGQRVPEPLVVSIDLSEIRLT